ncbi:MAG: DUF4348 domain-containing protein [Prevotella sp.]|nr:DUF4348 domain-containing protein [Prevotella sp.]
MRKSAIIVLIACLSMMLWTTGCTDKKKAVAADSTSVTDTIADTTAVDSLEDLIDDVPVSKAVDELFDDFFFNFAGNRKLQMKRIQFPLPVVNDGQTAQISKSQWKMERFFMPQGFYTLILDNRKQLNLSKDTSVSHVVVEQINLEEQRVKKYNFDRKNGEWMLTSVNNSAMVQNNNSSFLKFYQRFATDSAFQMKSLSNPIAFTGPDPDDDFETISGDLLPEQWPDVGPTDLPGDLIYNIIYGQEYKESTQKIFLLRGIANGQELQMTFKAIGGEWKLTGLVE